MQDLPCQRAIWSTGPRERPCGLLGPRPRRLRQTTQPPARRQPHVSREPALSSYRLCRGEATQAKASLRPLEYVYLSAAPSPRGGTRSAAAPPHPTCPAPATSPAATQPGTCSPRRGTPPARGAGTPRMHPPPLHSLPPPPLLLPPSLQCPLIQMPARAAHPRRPARRASAWRGGWLA